MRSRNIPLLFNTVRYLKPRQIIWRLRYSFRKKGNIYKSKFSVIYSTAKIGRLLKYCTPFLTYAFWNQDDIRNNRFGFLNTEVHYQEKPNWADTRNGRLWLYNLHYFQYLHCTGRLDCESAVRLINDWIANNPPGTPDAWDPFPISLRVVNWLKYVSEVKVPESSLKKIVESAYHQVLWLEKSLEYHLLANHLFKNIKALIFAGLFFEGEDASRWLAKGLRLLREELKEQVLMDGGHFERSPMYHSMILEDCLDLLNILMPYKKFEQVSEELEAISRRMLNFLFLMAHPDGQIALFNDAAFSIELPPEELRTYYENITSEEIHFGRKEIIPMPETGYFVMCPDNGEKLIIDCGNIGPDYQPGHAHCDTLSFELFLKGRRVIVDSGCYEYEPGEMRDYNRGNEGHNTLTIDGKNQSEVWGSHRCARRAKPLYARMQSNGDKVLRFEGAHDGYRRLSGSPVHHRRVEWYPERIQIEDRVEGSGYHGIESRLHFNPSLDVDFDGKSATVTANGEHLLSVTW